MKKIIFFLALWCLSLSINAQTQIQFGYMGSDTTRPTTAGLLRLVKHPVKKAVILDKNPSNDLILLTYPIANDIPYSLVPTSGTTGTFLKKTSGSSAWTALTKSDVGLGSVDNTPDSGKPISTAQQTALDLKTNKATLLSNGFGISAIGDLSANRTIGADSSVLRTVANSWSKAQVQSQLDKLPHTGIGEIINQSSWASLTDYTQTSGFTVTSGKIQAVGDGSGNQYLSSNHVSALDNYAYKVNWKIVSTTSSDAGLAIMMRSVNSSSHSNVSTKAYINTATGADFGKVFFSQIINNNPTTYKSTTYIPAISIGDSLSIEIRQTAGVVLVTGWNYTTKTNVSLSLTTSFQYGNVSYINNTSKPSIVAGNGTYLISSIRYSSSSQKNPLIAVRGNSITQGFYAGSSMNRYAYLINATIIAGAGDETSSVIAELNEIISVVKPSNLFLMIGGNDVAFGVSSGTWQANYATITTTLKNAGINVIHLCPTPRTGTDVTALRTFIIANYPTSYIDTYTPLVGSGTSLNSIYDSGDGTHLNAAGNALLASTIMAHYLYTNIVSNLSVLSVPHQPDYATDNPNMIATRKYVDTKTTFPGTDNALVKFASNGIVESSISDNTLYVGATKSIVVNGSIPSRHNNTSYTGLFFTSSNSGVFGETFTNNKGLILNANVVRNNTSFWTCQDTSKPGWQAIMNYEADNFSIFRASATSSTISPVSLFSISNSGNAIHAGNVALNGTIPSRHNNNSYASIFFNSSNSSVTGEVFTNNKGLVLNSNVVRNNSLFYTCQDTTKAGWQLVMSYEADKFSINRSAATSSTISPATFFSINSDGAVGVGTSTANSSTILDVSSTTKGARLPSMTSAQRNTISSPAIGSEVFDTDIQKKYVYTTSGWEQISSYKSVTATTYDAPDLPAQSATTTTVAVTGAIVGDMIRVKASIYPNGVLISGAVSSSGTVTITLYNTGASGGAVDLASATYTVYRE